MRYLVINPFGIGDVLFSTPLVRALKKSGPEVFLGYWCNRRVGGVLSANRYIDRIFCLSRGDLKKDFNVSLPYGMRSLFGVMKDISNWRFDAAFDLSLDHRYGLICALCGIKKRFGYDFKGRGRFLTGRRILKGYRQRHVAEFYLDLLEGSGISSQGKEMDLFLDASDVASADKLLSSHGVGQGEVLVGVAPGGGASWGDKAHLKYWPKESFAGLCSKLSERSGCRIILFGDENDAPLTAGISESMITKPVNTAGKTTLGVLAALISRTRLLISNDSGILHMARALKVSTVSFFGPSDESVYGPYPVGQGDKVLSGKLTCRPCYNDFRLNGCRNDNACLKGISVNEACEAAEKLLKIKLNK